MTSNRHDSILDIQCFLVSVGGIPKSVQDNKICWGSNPQLVVCIHRFHIHRFNQLWILNTAQDLGLAEYVDFELTVTED